VITKSRPIHVDLPAHCGFDAFQPADLGRRQEQQELWRLDTRCDELVDRDAGSITISKASFCFSPVNLVYIKF
jgi:hypothetical protein